MCLTPCRLATGFSILRATSVSSCAGDAPGSAALTMTVGRSMSGNCWIFIALKLIRPTSVSMMNSSTDGIGLRMHQAETLTFIAGLLRRSFGGGGRGGGGGLGRRGADDAHHVAIGEKGAARRHDPRRGIDAGGDLALGADAAADGALGLGAPPVRRHVAHVAAARAEAER